MDCNRGDIRMIFRPSNPFLPHRGVSHCHAAHSPDADEGESGNQEARRSSLKWFRVSCQGAPGRDALLLDSWFPNVLQLHPLGFAW
jgi:hypothetical protein